MVKRQAGVFAGGHFQLDDHGKCRSVCFQVGYFQLGHNCSAVGIVIVLFAVGIIVLDLFVAFGPGIRQESTAIVMELGSGGKRHRGLA